MNQLDIKQQNLQKKKQKLEKEIAELEKDPIYLAYKDCENNADYMYDHEQDLRQKIQDIPPYNHIQYTKLQKEAKSYRNISIGIHIAGILLNLAFLGLGIATGTFSWMVLVCGLGLNATAMIPGKEAKKAYKALDNIALQQEHLAKYKEELKSVLSVKNVNMHQINDLQNHAYPIIAQIQAKKQILYKANSQILRLEEEQEQQSNISNSKSR